MILKFIENIGDKTLETFSSFYEALKFTSICIIYMLQIKNYTRETNQSLIKQIYFTSVKIIPLFTILAMIFGYLIIGTVISLTMKYSLQGEMGFIIITLVVKEFAPLFTAFFVFLKFSTSLSTEMAIMNVTKELDKFKEGDTDIISSLFLPRIISGMISVTFLSIVLAISMLISGYIYTLFYSIWICSDAYPFIHRN